MELGFTGLLAFWYDSWLVVIGLVAAVALTAMVVVREDWTGAGPAVVAVLGLSILACLPLSMLRMGMLLAIDDPSPLGYLCILGTLVSIGLGAGRLYLRTRAEREQGIGAWSEGALDEGMSGEVTAQMQLGTEAGIEPLQADGGLAAGVTPAEGMVQVTGFTQAVQQAQTAWLHFTSGPREGQTIPLPAGNVNMGRGIDNDIVLDDATVSRDHATIAFQDGDYYIEDAGSMSGTMVEGMPATRTMLTSGATLKMGDAEFVFMRTEAGAPGTESTGTGSAGPAETVVMERPQSEVMAWLAVTGGPSKGKSIQLREGDNTIGRSPENDLSIEDPAISRGHALVRVQDDRMVLVDLGSRGGTRVGNRSIRGRTVSTGGVIEVGQTRLGLVEVEGQSPPELGTMSGETVVDAPSGGMAVLVAQSGPDSGKSFPLVHGDNLIGRDAGSNVLLTDDVVSRRHAMLRAEDNRYLVFDLGSRSGTVVDGNPVAGHEISGGATISMGQSEIVLMQPGS